MIPCYIFDNGEHIDTVFKADQWCAYPKGIPLNAYVYMVGASNGCGPGNQCWYRGDFTPLREEYVPKEYQTLLLLLI